jgi:transcriptional regulator with XRE-family HTH domain
MRSTYSSLYKALLDRLREARRARGLTQADVARAVGRPQSFVSKTESGERRLDAVELHSLAQLYGRPLSFFVGERSADGASVVSERRGRFSRRRKPAGPTRKRLRKK